MAMEIIEIKHPNGNLNEKYEILKNENGKIIKDGKYEKWYENGIKECEGEYLEDARFGYWKFWNENGELTEECEYNEFVKIQPENSTLQESPKLKEPKINKVKQTDLDRYNLLGNVKELELTDYIAKDILGEYEKIKKSGQEQIIIFNKDGNILKREINLLTNSKKVLNKYNDVGELTESELYIDNKLFHKSINIYDIDGKKTGDIRYDDKGTIIGKSSCKVDEYGNEIEIEIENSDYSAEGVLIWKDTYIYDSIVTNYIQTKNDSVLIWKDTYIYDSEGNLTEANHYQRAYDREGNLKESNNYSNEGFLISKYLWRYDSYGNMTEKLKYDHDGSLIEKSKIKYDQNKDVIEEMLWEKNGKGVQKKLEYRYEKYDESGNWILRLKLENDNLTSLTERKIIYYDLEKDDNINLEELYGEYKNYDQKEDLKDEQKKNSDHEQTADSDIKAKVFEEKVLYSLNYFKNTKKPLKILQKYHGLSGKEAKEWIDFVIKKHNLKYY